MDVLNEPLVRQVELIKAPIDEHTVIEQHGAHGPIKNDWTRFFQKGAKTIDHSSPLFQRLNFSLNLLPRNGFIGYQTETGFVLLRNSKILGLYGKSEIDYLTAR